MFFEKNYSTIDRKGISPLIATVLLIGFAVAIAALVILWGTGIIKERIDKTGAYAQGKLGCESDVEIDVDDACKSPAGKRIVVGVENMRSGALPSIRGRVVDSDGAASSSASGVNLAGYEKKRIAFVYDDSLISDPKAIEVIPMVLSGQETVSCDTAKIAIEVTRNC